MCLKRKPFSGGMCWNIVKAYEILNFGRCELPFTNDQHGFQSVLWLEILLGHSLLHPPRGLWGHRGNLAVFSGLKCWVFMGYGWYGDVCYTKPHLGKLEKYEMDVTSWIGTWVAVLGFYLIALHQDTEIRLVTSTLKFPESGLFLLGSISSPVVGPIYTQD